MIKKISLFACTALALLAANEFSNRRAPSFSLPDVSMMQHDILDSRGKVLILEFMQTKCEKCQMLTKMMESKIKPKYGANISIISVVVPPDNFDDVKKYIGVFKVTSPIVFDMGQVAGSYVKASPQKPAMFFPHLFLIDQKGMIRNDWQWQAQSAYPEIMAGEGLMTEIDKLLAEAASSSAPKKK